MQVFQQLGKEVETLWRDRHYNEDAFAAICEEALRDTDLPAKVSAWEIVNWALGETTLPQQRDLPAKFGDPPITLYNSPRFHIDIYFWLEGTTEIHQHGFCGAFQVLLGSSIHSHYEFDVQEKINSFTELGGLDLAEVELLQVGDIRPILAGRQFIHALFHLDHPSATVVIRTHSSPLHLPQFSYRKPTLAIDPYFEEPNTLKKIQTISMLVRTKHPQTNEMISSLLAGADFQTSYFVLSNIKHMLGGNQLDQMFGIETSQNTFDKFLEQVIKRHGATAGSLPDIFAEQNRLEEIVSRRSYISHPEHRFFLALLLNVTDRENVLSLIKHRFPESDPIDKILDWSLDLAETKVVGLNLPNALGIEDFGDHDLFVLECVLNGRSEDETRQAIKDTYPTDTGADLLNSLPERYEKLRRSVLLRSLA
ncbi:MAG TPA: hypothetical protein VGO50_20840 [Pyrinomonadaceae bacterium]|jgi:hypothetical protein|nr:hypothetical protein [Pyrinomonadaceae bacterium]